MRPTNIDSNKIFRTEVEERDKTRVFGKGPSEPAVRSTGKSVFFIGPEGSGRRETGRVLAGRLKLGFVELHDAEALEATLAGERVVASVDKELLLDERLAGLLQNQGVVFYTMAGVQAVAEARGLVADEECKRRIFAEIDEWEPLFMRTLHFLLPGGAGPEGLAASAADKLYLVR
ncbi:MAG: hypothetical protein AB7E32_12630 [Desulfovibrio sp.]